MAKIHTCSQSLSKKHCLIVYLWIASISNNLVNKLPVTIKSNLNLKKRFPTKAMNFYLVKKKINILSFKFECLPISLYRALLIKEIYIAAMTIQPRLLNPHIFNDYL